MLQPVVSGPEFYSNLKLMKRVAGNKYKDTLDYSDEEFHIEIDQKCRVIYKLVKKAFKIRTEINWPAFAELFEKFEVIEEEEETLSLETYDGTKYFKGKFLDNAREKDFELIKCNELIKTEVWKGKVSTQFLLDKDQHKQYTRWMKKVIKNAKSL
jgi:hypothetical protein